MVFLLSPEFDPFLSDEVAKETDSVVFFFVFFYFSRESCRVGRAPAVCGSVS